MWDLCAERKAVFCGPGRRRDEERQTVILTRLKILEYRQKAHIWALAAYADDEMRSTDLFLCLWETCVPKVRRCCAVQNTEKMEKDE